MKAKMNLITPDLARQYLEKNTGNRNVSKNHVMALTKEILSGNWQVSPQGISFDINGKLIDGQHRLCAIVKANKPIPMLVFTEIKDSVFSILDNGKARSAGDILHIEGIKSSRNVAACIKTWDKIRRGYLSSSNNTEFGASNSDVLKFYNERPEFWARIYNAGYQLYVQSLQIVNPQIITGMLAYWEDRNESTAFIESVLKNDNTVINAQGLNRHFTNCKLKRKIITQSETLKLFFKYHNLSKKGLQAKNFFISENEKVLTF